MKQLLVLLCALLLAATGAQARLFRGTVSHVSDGDSLWVRPEGRGQAVELRLLDIDAPELCQPYGRQAKKAIAARLLYQAVLVRTRSYDDYGRALAQVRHRDEDMGAWMVRQGEAWSGTFHNRPGPYAKLQEEARRARRGLWAAAKAPEEPRAFRKRHGSCP